MRVRESKERSCAQDGAHDGKRTHSIARKHVLSKESTFFGANDSEGSAIQMPRGKEKHVQQISPQHASGLNPTCERFTALQLLSLQPCLHPLAGILPQPLPLAAACLREGTRTRVGGRGRAQDKDLGV